MLEVAGVGSISLVPLEVRLTVELTLVCPAEMLPRNIFWK